MERCLSSYIQRHAIYDRDKGICHKCGEHVGYHDMELDHVVPFALGGKTTPENLKVCCRKCNAAAIRNIIRQRKEQGLPPLDYNIKVTNEQFESLRKIAAQHGYGQSPRRPQSGNVPALIRAIANGELDLVWHDAEQDDAPQDPARWIIEAGQAKIAGLQRQIDDTNAQVTQIADALRLKWPQPQDGRGG